MPAMNFGRVANVNGPSARLDAGVTAASFFQRANNGTQNRIGVAAMAIRFLRGGALIIALCLSVGACMQNKPYNETQPQYLNELRPCQPGTHSESFPNTQNGY